MQKGYTDLDSLIIPTTIVDALRLLFPIDATTIIHQIEINLLTDHTACTVQLKIDETMCVCVYVWSFRHSNRFTESLVQSKCLWQFVTTAVCIVLKLQLN